MNQAKKKKNEAFGKFGGTSELFKQYRWKFEHGRHELYCCPHRETRMEVWLICDDAHPAMLGLCPVCLEGFKDLIFKTYGVKV